MLFTHLSLGHANVTFPVIRPFEHQMSVFSVILNEALSIEPFGEAMGWKASVIQRASSAHYYLLFKVSGNLRSCLRNVLNPQHNWRESLGFQKQVWRTEFKINIPIRMVKFLWILKAWVVLNCWIVLYTLLGYIQVDFDRLPMLTSLHSFLAK